MVNIIKSGSRKGLGGFVWICKIIVPVSLVIALIQWSGWLHQLSFLFDPLMKPLSLPGEAVLPIISGIIINLYATIAIISVMPFTVPQMTLIAVFSLIAHNFIVEGIVQQKSGIGIVKTSMIRIAAAVLAVFIVSRFFGGTASSVLLPAAITEQIPVTEALKTWGAGILLLSLRIFIIIMTIMIALEALRTLGWMGYLLKFFKPFIKILGLSERTAMPWITAVIFGLMYGGAAIVEEVKSGVLTKDETERLHISIGINHSMLEDPALFLALGLNGFWLWVPKLVIAAIAVHIYRAARRLANRTLHA